MTAQYFKNLKINVQHDSLAQTFSIPFSPEPVCLEYQVSEDSWEITQVRIPQEARRLNLGASLMEYVLETARRDKILIVPKCSYARNFFHRNPRFESIRFTK